MEGHFKYFFHGHCVFEIDCWGKMRSVHLLGFVLKLNICNVTLVVVTLVRQFCDIIVK